MVSACPSIQLWSCKLGYKRYNSSESELKKEIPVKEKLKLMAKRVIFLIFLGMSIFGMLGCSNNSELTRSNAEQIIKAQIKYPKDVLGVCPIKRRAGADPQYAAYVTSYRALFEQFQAQGVITYTAGSVIERGTYSIDFTGTLTDKGKPFVVGLAPNEDNDSGNIVSKFLAVKTAQLEFGEITGIVEHKESSTADVQYTEKVTLTPFGVALAVATGPLARTATFTKYDDGWRLNNATR